MGEAGAGGKRKAGQSNHLDSSSSAVPLSMGSELVQSTGWAKTAGIGAAWYPISAPQGREMHHRDLAASVKSRL